MAEPTCINPKKMKATRAVAGIVIHPSDLESSKGSRHRKTKQVCCKCSLYLSMTYNDTFR
jgi:hypothetical protein